MTSEQFNRLEDKVDTLVEINARVLGYLENNKFTNTPGLVQRMGTIETRVQELSMKVEVVKPKKGIYINLAWIATLGKFLFGGFKVLKGG